jgi:hypothetical protein
VNPNRAPALSIAVMRLFEVRTVCTTSPTFLARAATIWRWELVVIESASWSSPCQAAASAGGDVRSCRAVVVSGSPP